jgi:hypothetical protein
VLAVPAGRGSLRWRRVAGEHEGARAHPQSCSARPEAAHIAVATGAGGPTWLLRWLRCSGDGASQRSGVLAAVRGGETSCGGGWDGGGPEDERGQRTRCSARPAMAAASALDAFKRQRARERGTEWEARGTSVGRARHPHQQGRGATTRQGEALAAAHGGHVHATRPPLGHFLEHVAGSGLGMVEHDFGPNWTLDLKGSLKPARCSIFFV